MVAFYQYILLLFYAKRLLDNHVFSKQWKLDVLLLLPLSDIWYNYLEIFRA